MNLKNLVENAKRFGRTSLSKYLLASSVLISSLSLGCETRTTIIQAPPENANNQNDPYEPPPSEYSSVTGAWDLSTKSDFSNDKFKGSLDVNLNLTQMNNTIGGSFSGLGLLLQNKNDGTLYPVYQGAYGSIVNGEINPDIISHNLKFSLASQNYIFRGVSPTYESMWGDLTVKINMTTIFGTSDGIITLTGMWGAERR